MSAAESSPIDARRAYELWLAMIRDEALYDALIAGTHAALADAHGFSSHDLAILDEFRSQPGLRWNVENLRFRSALHTTGNLLLTMQRTLYLLTRADEDWIQELVFEYLAHHQWQEFGHAHFAEAERFAEYVRKRVLKRRTPPAHIDAVLAFELAVARHLGGLTTMQPEDWPAPRALSLDAVAAAAPSPPKSATVVHVPVDLTDWIRSGDPRTGVVRDGEISILVTVPSRDAPHRFQRLSPEVRALYDRCDGRATTREILDELGDDYDRDDALALVSRWIESGALTVPA